MIVLNKLYEKTIQIAQEHKTNSELKSQIIKNQVKFVSDAQDTIARIKEDNRKLTSKNAELKGKLKTRTLQVILVGLFAVLQTALIITK